MSRIRSIHPGICIDKGLANMDDARAERTFMRLWTYADDDGRCYADERLIKAALFPRLDSMGSVQVAEDINLLARHGFIVRYSVDGEDYLHIPSFGRHQKPNRKVDSKLPQPPSTVEAVQAPRVVPPVVVVGVVVGKKPVTQESGHVDDPNSVPIPDDFSDFWNLYPKRNDKKLGKATSGRLWSKLSHGDRAVALSAVTNYAEACDTALTISKDPERWLRGRCWVDWLEPAKVASSTRAVGGVLAGSVAFGDSYYGRSQR